ncbi:MAG: hypothetical protein M1298_02280, partial [Chloroflexi bacterium]|nr:hypothetical protein [Chloroflexota bacterium]
SNVPRTDLVLNVEHYHVQGFAQAVFWPYLGSQPIHDRTWFNYAPPLQMNWQKGQLLNLASFLPDSEPENGEQIFSVYPFHRHGTNVADFENPFAYYRFDPGHTGFPNLIIRSYFFPAGDTYRQYGGTPLPAEFIRYSWGNGNGLMLYKIGLLGRYPAQSLVPVGEAAIKTMDYGTFPAWIMSHVWDFATFVANEKGGFRSSEGIYEWDQAPGLFSYAYGYRDRLPLDYYRSIAPGYRGELNPVVTTAMRLYVSKVDGRLHSLGATQGVWNVDGNQLIRTGTLDGEHIGEWHRFVTGREVESLYHVPGWLLYSADGQVEVEQVPRGLNSGPLSPPVNEATLQTLRNALPAHQPDIAAQGLSAMLPAAAPALTIDGVGLQDVAETASAGWHAELLPASTVALAVGRSFPQAGVVALTAALHCGGPRIAGGKDLFTCRPPAIDPVKLSFDGIWHAERLTPAAVKIVQVRVGTTGATAPYAEQPVSIVVANRGQAIARDVRLAIWAQRKGYPRVALTDLAVTIPGGQQQDLQFDWLPGRPGDWTVQVLLEPAAAAADRTVQEVDTHLLLRQASPPPWWKLGPLSSGRLIGEAFVLLGCGSVFAGVAVLYLTRRRAA